MWMCISQVGVIFCGKEQNINQNATKKSLLPEIERMVRCSEKEQSSYRSSNTPIRNQCRIQDCWYNPLFSFHVISNHTAKCCRSAAVPLISDWGFRQVQSCINEAKTKRFKNPLPSCSRMEQCNTLVQNDLCL